MVCKKYLLQGKSKSCGCRGNYKGATFGGITIVSGGGEKYPMWLCQHGKKFLSRFTLNGPRLNGCPCDSPMRRSEGISRHGESPHSVRTNEYNVWRMMRQRCNDENNPAFKYYGGRGIKVCERWDLYENFIADMGQRPRGTSLDRIDSNGNYEPSNCRWADKYMQARNKRNIPVFEYKGEKKSVAEWASIIDCRPCVIWSAAARMKDTVKAIAWAESNRGRQAKRRA